MAKLVDTNRATVNKLKNVFRKDPELAWLVPHVTNGYKILQYMFAAVEAAEKVKTPRGIEFGGLDVRIKNLDDKKAMGAITVAGWMIDKLSEQLKSEGL